MKEKLTITISSKNKHFIKQFAKKQNKSVSESIDDLLTAFIKNEREKNKKDKWLAKTAGAYSTGKKDIFSEWFKELQK